MTMLISLMLAVEDAQASAQWYVSALGAREMWNLGSVIGLSIEGAPFFLHEPTDQGFASPASLGHTTVRIEVFLDDPDAFIDKAVASGATSSVGGIQNHHTPWGAHRQGGFIDPFGHAWLVGDRSPLRNQTN